MIAVNDVGESTLSEAYSFIAAAAPGVPGKPAFTQITEDSIEVAWTASEDNGSPVTSYNIYVSINSG